MCGRDQNFAAILILFLVLGSGLVPGSLDSRPTSLQGDIAALKSIQPDPAVERLLRRGPHILPAIIKALDDPDLREGARRVVWRSSDAGRPYLIQGLRHPNSYVREVVYNSMENRLPLKDSEIRSLIKLLRYKNPRTVQMSCQLLASNGPGSRSAYNEIKTLLRRGEIYNQTCARQALLILDLNRARIDLRNLLRHPDYEIRSTTFALIMQHTTLNATETGLLMLRPNPAALQLLQQHKLSQARYQILARARQPRGPHHKVQAHKLEWAILLDTYNPEAQRSMEFWYAELAGLSDLRLSDRRFQYKLRSQPEAVCSFVETRKTKDYLEFQKALAAGPVATPTAHKQLLEYCYYKNSSNKTKPL